MLDYRLAPEHPRPTSAEGWLTVPIAAIYPLDQVREAYAELADGHVCGKIVLSTEMAADAPPPRS